MRLRLQVPSFFYFCALKRMGCRKAEIIPFEPDTGNAGVGKRLCFRQKPLV